MPKVMNKDGSLVPLAKTIYKSNPHYWADSGVGYVFCGFCKKSFRASSILLGVAFSVLSWLVFSDIV